jgi:TetR/AcrR family transcriptional repressor of nem operon
MRVLKQPRALATRERIVAAAAQLFALKGFHDTKLEEILTTAAVTTGAFFHHFQSKEDLAFAVIDRHMEKRRARLDRIEQDLPRPAAAEPLAAVFRRLDAIVEMVRRRGQRKGGCVIGNLSTALSDTHDAFRRRLAECFDEMALEFKPHLDAAVQALRLHPAPDTRDLARYVVTVIEGAIMLGRTRQDRRLIGRHFQHLKNYLRQSLQAGKLERGER